MSILCQLATDAHFSIFLLPFCFSFCQFASLRGWSDWRIARIFKNTLLKIKSLHKARPEKQTFWAQFGIHYQMVVRTYCIFAMTQPLKGTSCSRLWASALCYWESCCLLLLHRKPFFSLDIWHTTAFNLFLSSRDGVALLTHQWFYYHIYQGSRVILPTLIFSEEGQGRPIWYHKCWTCMCNQKSCCVRGNSKERWARAP